MIEKNPCYKNGISLLVPSFNASKFLPRLIEQALQQSVPFAEMICYNDGSQDNTSQVASSLGMHVIDSKCNRGSAYARNRLLEAATQPYVHFHDADDEFYSPRFLEKIRPNLSPNTAVFCSWVMEDITGNNKLFTYEKIVDCKDWTSYLINHHIHLNAIIYPRDFLLNHGGFDEKLRIQQDLFLNIVMAFNGIRFQWVPETLAKHTKRIGSTLDMISPEDMQRASLSLVESLRQKIPREYYGLLEKKVLFHAKKLLDYGELSDIQRIAKLLNQCKVTALDSGGPIERFISRFGGWELYLLYYYWRTRLPLASLFLKYRNKKKAQ